MTDGEYSGVCMNTCVVGLKYQSDISITFWEKEYKRYSVKVDRKHQGSIHYVYVYIYTHTHMCT